MIIHLIVVLIIFSLAYYIDGKIRKKIYTVDINLATINAKKDFNVKSKRFEQSMNNSYQELINMNNHRYGIIGNFDYNIHPSHKYELVGKITNIGNGVVLEKKRVTRDDVVNDMAKFIQDKKKSFVADASELRERYIVVMYVQENMAQFAWDDERLHDNVEVGDKVTVSYDKGGIISVGYRVKGEQSDPNTKKELDVGTNQKVSGEKWDTR